MSRFYASEVSQLKKIWYSFKTAHWAVKTFVWFVIGVLFISFVAGINTSHLSPFTTTKKLNLPVDISVSEKGAVYIDDDLRSLCFCDINGRIIRIVDLRNFGSPADTVAEVHIFGDYVYAVASSRISNGLYFKSEYILRFDLMGNYIDTVYQIDYPQGAHKDEKSIQALGDNGKELLFTVIDGSSLTVYKQNPEKEQTPLAVCSETFDTPIISANFIPTTGDVIVRTRFNDVYYCDMAAGKSEKLTDKNIEELLSVLSRASLPKTYIIDDEALSMFVVCPVYFRNQEPVRYYIITDSINNSMYLFDYQTDETIRIESFPLSIGLFISNLTFWLAAVVFGCILLAVLVYFIKKNWNRHLRTFSIMLLVLIVVVAFFSINEREMIAEQHYSNLLSISRLMSRIIDERYGDWLKKTAAEQTVSDITKGLAEKRPDVIQAVNGISDIANMLCDSQDEENSYYACILLTSPDNKVYYVANSTGLTHYGSVNTEWEDIDEEIMASENKVSIVKDPYGVYYYYTYSFIRDDQGRIIGIYEVGNIVNNLLQKLNVRAFNLGITLLALLVVVYVLFRIVGTFRANLKDYKAQRKADNPERGASLLGAYSFLHTVSTSLDSVILPLLAMRMCEGMSPQNAAMMAVLPMTAKTVGMWAGQFLFVPLNRRLGERRCAILSEIICISMFLMLAMCVGIGNIYLFSLAKLIFALFSFGIMNAYRRTIPVGTGNETLRKKSLLSENQGTVAATVLSILLGGFIAEYLNDVMVYISGAVLSIPLLVLCFIMFLPGQNEQTVGVHDPETRTGRRKSALSILLIPSVTMLLLFLYLPCFILSGYRSYLFPIYTKSVGMSESVLSALYIFIYTFIFATSRQANKTIDSINYDKYAFPILLVPCLCLMVSVISQNVYWGVLCLFVCEFSVRQIQYIFGISTFREICKSGIDKKTARHYVSIVQYGIEAAVNPLFALLAPLGHFLGGAVIGTVCLLLGSVRAVRIRNNNRRNPAAVPPEAKV